MQMQEKTSNCCSFVFVALLCIMPNSGLAQQETTVSSDSLQVLWVCLCAGLVFLMQGGFALLESGMVRAKNTVNVLMKNYADMCFGSLVFWLVGYGIMFGENMTGWFGMTHFSPTELTNLQFSDLFYQMMFAATAATIVSGALAERVYFHSYIIVVVFIAGLIYPVFGGWVWNDNGWLAQLGFIDFAGSTVVHSVGAWCALAGVWLIGPRLGRYSQDGKLRQIAGHNLTLVGLSAFLLWFGWFGFNGGGVLISSENLALIFLNTHLSGASAVVTSIILMASLKKPVLSTTTIASGIGGLVAITAGAPTMDPFFAIVSGSIAGMIVVAGRDLMDYFKLDDVVGAIPVHGFCGAWGTLAAGMFYSGNMFDLNQIKIQLIGIIVAILWTLPLSLAVFLFIKEVTGLRIDSVRERRGLDYSEHYEDGYPEFQQTQLHDREK